MITSHLPFEPLERHLRLQWGTPTVADIGGAGAADHGLWCDRQAAVMLDAKPNTVTQWRKRGVRAALADDLACRAGTHPLLVWGDDWVGAEDEGQVRQQEMVERRRIRRAREQRRARARRRQARRSAREAVAPAVARACATAQARRDRVVREVVAIGFELRQNEWEMAA